MKAKGALAVSCLAGELVWGAHEYALGANACNAETVKGAYGFAVAGLVPEKQPNGNIRHDPISQEAIVKYDGQGRVSVEGPIQYHGTAALLRLTGGVSDKR